MMWISHKVALSKIWIAGPTQDLEKYQLLELDPMIEKPEITKLPTEAIKESADEDNHVEINNSCTGFLEILFWFFIIDWLTLNI